MRVAPAVLLVFGVVSAVRGVPRPQQDADAVLSAMRNALGGEAVLDGVKSLSMTATGRMEIKGMSMGIADQYHLLFPDHYLRTRRLVANMSAARVVDAALTEGFRGDHLIRLVGMRKTPRPAVPDADRLALAKLRHDAARIVLVLTGRSLTTYPLAFGFAGTEDIGGIAYDIVEARGPGEVLMRLYVDKTTHLPAMVASSGLEKTPDTRWFVSEFKKTDRLNWPREFEERLDGGHTETLTIKSWKLNPPLDPRTFDPR